MSDLNRIWGLVVVLCVGLAGCQGPDAGWLIEGLVAPRDAQRLGYTSAWRRDLRIPQASRIASVQVLGDLLVVVEAPTNYVTAVELDSGEVRWTHRVGQHGEQVSPPVRVDGRILVNTQPRRFTLDATTGRTLRTHNLDAVVTSSPVIYDDLAIFASGGGRVFAQVIDTGRTEWAYQLSNGIDVRPALYEDDLLVADTSGAYKLLSARTGMPRWSGRSFARNSAQPLLTRFGAFVASEDTNLYALNRSTGRDRWVYASGRPLHADPSLIGEILYLPVPDRGLVALDPRTGDELWTVSSPEPGGRVAPIADDGARQIMWMAPRLVTVDTQTGQPMDAAFVGRMHKVFADPEGGLILVGGGGEVERLLPLIEVTAL